MPATEEKGSEKCTKEPELNKSRKKKGKGANTLSETGRGGG